MEGAHYKSSPEHHLSVCYKAIRLEGNKLKSCGTKQFFYNDAK